MSNMNQIINEIITTGINLQKMGFIAGSDGNISAKLQNGNILITPSGFRKDSLQETDLVQISEDGNIISGNHKPSSEIAMHLLVYKNRPDISACVHSHPPYSTAFAVAGEEIPSEVLPEMVLFVGRVPLTDYAPPGTDKLPESLLPFIKNHNAFLLRNHGLLTVGKTLLEAYNRHETVEHTAKIINYARQLGTICKIPKSDFDRLEKLRNEQNKA